MQGQDPVAPTPRRLEFGKVLPMLAESVNKPFDGAGWLFEVKWDGYRALAFLDRGGPDRARLQSRRRRDLTPAYPELGGLTGYLDGRRAVVDGEIVAFRDGLPDFQALQRGGRPVTYVAFDLLELDGDLLLERPLAERKRLLAQRLGSGPALVHSAVVPERGRAFYEAAVSRGLEGVVAKRAGSLYYPGQRRRDWLKVRNVRRTLALVCGYTKAADARPFGALVLGAFGPGGELLYAGHVGAGFDQREMARLLRLLRPRERCSFARGEPAELRGRVTWVKPERVAEIEYLEWTRDGRLRHPVYRGLRPDKDAAEVRAPASNAAGREP